MRSRGIIGAACCKQRGFRLRSAKYKLQTAKYKLEPKNDNRKLQSKNCRLRITNQELQPSNQGPESTSFTLQTTNYKLLGPDRKNVFTLNLDLDAEGRAKIRPLRNSAAYPYAAGKIRQLERVEECSAAGVPHHGMFCGAKAVIIFQLLEIRDVFKLAVAEGGVLGEGPITVLLRGRAGWQADQQRRDILAGQSIADKEFFGEPGLGHFRHVGNPGFRFRGVRKQRDRVGRGRREFDLRRLIA